MLGFTALFVDRQLIVAIADDEFICRFNAVFQRVSNDGCDHVIALSYVFQAR